MADGTFSQVQQLLATPQGTVVMRRSYPTDRTHALRSLLPCRVYGRRLQGSWNNNQAYYRCLPQQKGRPGHPCGVYLREAAIVPPLSRWLTSERDQTKLPKAVAAAITAVIAAPQADRAVLHAQLGLRLIHQPDQRTVRVRMKQTPTRGRPAYDHR